MDTDAQRATTTAEESNQEPKDGGSYQPKTSRKAPAAADPERLMKDWYFLFWSFLLWALASLAWPYVA